MENKIAAGLIDYDRQKSVDSHNTEGSGGSTNDLNDWQQGIIADKDVDFPAIDASQYAVAQAPTLEVIEEHEILETLPVPSIQSPAEGWSVNEAAESTIGDPSRPTFALGATIDDLAGLQHAIYPSAHSEDQLRPSSPSAGMSRQDSATTMYSFYSRQNSATTGPHGLLAPEILEPLLYGASATGSEMGISRDPSERKLSSFFREVSGKLTRKVFGGDVMSRPESVASMDVNASGHLETSRRSSTQRPELMRFNSHTSVTSDASTVYTTRSAISRRSRPARILAPAGNVVPRSKRFLTRGQAGFLNARGNSAINLRFPEMSTIKSACAECPYCRKFTTLGNRIQLPAPGSACTCRICVIIDESNSNQAGVKNILEQQNATKKKSMRGGSSERRPPGLRPHTHKPGSELGAFCSQCSTTNLGSMDSGGSFSRSNQLKPNFGPQVGVPLKDQWPVPVQADVTVEKGGPGHCLSPSYQTSTNTSVESVFVASLVANRALRREFSNQPSMGPILSVTGNDQNSLCASRMSVACQSVTSGVSAPFCRICHQLNDVHQTLMAPCRCSGSLKYVHEDCLIHWLEISSRKYRRPAVCELCHFKYHRQRHFRFTRLVMPRCRTADKLWHGLTILSIVTMFACAAITLAMFQMEDQRYLDQNLTGEPQPLKASEIVTLIAGLLFFIMFFVAMYSQVKATQTLTTMIGKWWKVNHEWSVLEYNPKFDTKFLKEKDSHDAARHLQQQQAARTHADPSSHDCELPHAPEKQQLNFEGTKVPLPAKAGHPPEYTPQSSCQTTYQTQPSGQPSIHITGQTAGQTAGQTTEQTPSVPPSQ